MTSRRRFSGTLMAAEWYCRISGEEQGPLSAVQLRALVLEGQLTPGDAVRQGRSAVWVPAVSVRGLFGEAPEASGELPPLSPPKDAAHAARPRPLLRAVPMEEEPPALPKPPPRIRPGDHHDAGLDLSGMPAAGRTEPVSPPKQVKGWRSSGLDFLAQSPPSAPKTASVVGHRDTNSAESLRRWTIPLLSGAFALLLVVWIVIVQLRSPEVSSGTPDGGASPSPMEATPGVVAAQQTSGKSVQGPPPPPKAGPAGAVEPAGVTWINASREPWKCGDVTVKVLGAAIGRAKLVDAAKRVSDSQDEYLLLSIEVANHSATRKIQYKSWNLRDDQVRLSDDLKNPYTLQVAPGGASFEGQQRTKSIYPEKTVEDVLVFERPVERARTLRLQLPAGAFEASGTGYLEISMSMVKSESGPNFRPPPPGPPGAKAQPVAPKNEEKTADAPKVAVPAKPPTSPKVPQASPPARTRTPESDFGIKPDETPASPDAIPAKASSPPSIPRSSPSPPNGKAP